MRKILIINPFGIGDVLFTSPVVRAIKEAYPEASLTYWCNERVEGLVKNIPGIDKVFALSRGDIKRVYRASRLKGIYKCWGLLRQLKKEKFDIAFDFALEPHYSLVCWLCGIKRRVGFNYKGRGRFLTDKIEIQGYSAKHVVEYYLELLKPLGILPGGRELNLDIPRNQEEKIKYIYNRFDIRSTDTLVGIAPGAGASWGRDALRKHWPALRFAQLAEGISREFAAKILILGDDSDRAIADIIVNAMSGKPVNLVGKTSLEELIALIGNLRMLITNDGGPLHIAVALGVKTVSIFGPVDDLVYGPYPKSERHLVLKRDIACRPCYRDFKLPVCDRQRECINSIGTDEVLTAARRLW